MTVFEERKRNIISLIPGESTLEHLHTFPQFPVFIGCTDKPKEEDLFEDLVFDICSETGLIQVRNLLDPKLVYKDYHSEAVGSLWEKHHEHLSEEIASRCKDNIRILEIGGSNGKLANKIVNKLKKANKKFTYTIIEPSAKVDIPEVEVIQEFFNLNTKLPFRPNLIIHSHVLEHLYNPVGCLRKMRELLADDGEMIFSIPNMEHGLSQGYANVLNFEHTFLLDLAQLWNCLEETLFQLIRMTRFENHSLFFRVIKKQKEEQEKNSHCSAYREIFIDSLVNKNRQVVNELNYFINEIPNKKIYLFGAHIFYQLLVNLGLQQNKINGILDNSEIKKGKRLYGTSLQVYGPESIKDQENVTVIVKAGLYTDEICKQLKEINQNVELII